MCGMLRLVRIVRWEPMYPGALSLHRVIRWVWQ